MKEGFMFGHASESLNIYSPDLDFILMEGVGRLDVNYVQDEYLKKEQDFMEDILFSHD
jgi:hypothetical protein